MLVLLLNPHAPTLAALVTSTSDPISWLVNYGVAGIIIVLLVTGQLRTKAEVMALQKVADERAEALNAKDKALADLTQQITGHTLPQLARMTEVVEGISRKIEDIEREGR
jgi:hypothetical protein